MKQLHYTIPCTYNACSHEQLRALVRLMPLDRLQRRRGAFIMLSNMPSKQFRRLSQHTQAVLMAQVAWVERPDLTRLPFGRIAGMDVPAPSFEGVTMHDYIFAQQYVDAYQRSGQLQHLQDACISLLTLSGQADKQSSSSRSRRRELLKSAKLEDLLLLVTYFTSCVNKVLRKDAPKLFGSTAPDKPAKAPDWRDISLRVSGKALGTLPEVLTQEVRTVFAYIQQLMTDAEQAQQAARP